MILLSIDASTKASGYAVFQQNKLIYYNCIQCENSNVLDRIFFMMEEFQKVQLRYRPDKIVMEEVLPQEVGHNQKVYKALIYLQAILVIMFHRYGKDVKLTPASHWRKVCGIKIGSGITREKLKNSSKNLVKGIYNIDVTDDISDAICLGLAEIKQGNGIK